MQTMLAPGPRGDGEKSRRGLPALLENMKPASGASWLSPIQREHSSPWNTA